MNSPKFNNKIYSFKDRMFESFSEEHEQDISRRISPNYLGNERNQPKNSNQIDEINKMSERFQMLNKMLKVKNKLKFQIPKTILHPSVLIINSKNKVKTQMLLDMNSNSENENSIIMCENAMKYLTFLEVIQQEQIIFANCQNKQTQVKDRSKPRIQFNQQAEKHSKNKQGIHKDTHFEYRKDQTIRNTGLGQNDLSQISQRKQENQLYNKDNTKYLTQHQRKNPNFKTSQSAQKLFKQIITPKSYKQPVSQGERLPPSKQVLVRVQSKQVSCVPKVIKNRKFQRPIDINMSNRQQDSKQKSNLSKYPDQNGKKYVNKPFQKQRQSASFYNQRSMLQKQKSLSKKQMLNNQTKTGYNKKQQKVTISKQLQTKNKSKNLALKVISHTNQFQRMLKMVSSGVNQHNN